jgi:Na+-translocating ferredoxin:NAD+ oxidoreductase RNF subunit RnfB
MWCWRKMEIGCTICVENEEVLKTVKKEKNILHKVKRRKANGWVTFCIGPAV